jgi:hypothetical protein
MAPASDIARSPSLSSVRRVSLERMIESSTALLLTAIGALIVGLALLILFHHNLNATKGYNLRSLEFARSQLLLEQELLNMELAKSQSLETLQSDKQVQVMVRPRRPVYIEGLVNPSVGVAQAEGAADAN